MTLKIVEVTEEGYIASLSLTTHLFSATELALEMLSGANLGFKCVCLLLYTQACDPTFPTSFVFASIHVSCVGSLSLLFN